MNINRNTACKSAICNLQQSEIRSAFTLIELLVVMGIILAMATIAVPLAMSLTERDQVGRGAMLLQGALNQAKYLAQRTGRPCGVRLLRNASSAVNASDPADPFYQVEKIEYIQDPGDFTDGWAWAVVAPPAGGQLVPQRDVSSGMWFPVNVPQVAAPAPNARIVYSPFSNQWADANTPSANHSAQKSHDFHAAFQSGEIRVLDFIEFNGNGQVYQIQQVLAPNHLAAAFPPPPSPPDPPHQLPAALILDRPLPLDIPLPTSLRSNYRITRQPRVIPGQQLVQMPRNVAVDVSLPPFLPLPATGYFTRGVTQVPNQAGTIEILFTPAGTVVGPGVGAGGTYLHLWLRDTSQRHLASQMLVSIHVRNGQVGSYPVNVNPATPYGNGTSPDPHYFAENGVGAQ